MRTLFYTSLFMFFSISCTSQSEYEKRITDFLEIKNGIRTDLQIKYSKLDISDILVADSTEILNKQFETERSEKISKSEDYIKHKEESIAQQERKNETASSQNKVVSNSLITMWTKELNQEKANLENIKSWKPEYLNRYENRKPSEALAKKADIRFSYFNPKLQTRQERSAIIILSADGTNCYKMIPLK